MTKYLPVIALAAAAAAVVLGAASAEASFYNWCGWEYKAGCSW